MAVAAAVPSDLYDRFLFNTREQVDGEPIHVFAQSLQNLVNNCHYMGATDSHLSSLVRDRFIAGLLDKDLQFRLLQFKSCDLPLETAIDLAVKNNEEESKVSPTSNAVKHEPIDSDVAATEPTVKIEKCEDDDQPSTSDLPEEDHSSPSNNRTGPFINFREILHDQQKTLTNKRSVDVPVAKKPRRKFDSPTQCIMCSETFTSPGAMNAHIRSKHQSGPTDDGVIACAICGTEFKNIRTLRDHVYRKHRRGDGSTAPVLTGETTCQICKKTLVDRHSLKMHYQKLHKELIEAAGGEDSKVCALCKDETKDILGHLAEKHNDNGLTCKICHRQLRQDESLRVHISQMHDKADGTICQYCGDPFIKIEDHIATWHKNEKPWKCDQCDFSHATKVGLKNHKLYYHPKGNAHMCHICPFKTHHKSNLKQHIQVVHEKERPFKCTECDKAYYHSRQLKDHMNVIHLNKMFECSECDKKFGNRHSFVNHMKAVHQGIWHKCDKCQSRFQNKEGLKRHLRKVHHEKGVPSN